MVTWGLRPVEFWSLAPIEFWWMVEARTPVKMYGSMTEAEVDELYQATFDRLD